MTEPTYLGPIEKELTISIDPKQEQQVTQRMRELQKQGVKSSEILETVAKEFKLPVTPNPMEEKKSEPKYLGEIGQGELTPPWSARYSHLAAIPPTAWELAKETIPGIKYLGKEEREKFKGLPSEPLLKEPISEWAPFEPKPTPMSKQKAIAEEVKSATEWAAFPSALKGVGKIAGEVLPKKAVEFMTKSRLFPWQKAIPPKVEIKPEITPEPMVSGMEIPPAEPTPLSITELARKAISPPVEPLPTSTSELLTAARKTTVPASPPKPGFLKTAEEILAEKDRTIGLPFEKRPAIKPEAKVEVPITPEALEAQVKGGMIGELPKYAGGEEVSAINLNRIEGTQDLLQFINQTAISLEKRIGKHKDTVEGIMAEAERWGLTPKESINMAEKLENFSNQMANIRQIHRNLAEETFNKIRTLPADPAQRTPDLMISLKAKLDQYSQTLVAASRVASQWGKAGAVLRAEAKYQPEWGYKQLLDRATKLLSDPKKANRFNDIVSRLQELKPDNLEEMSKFLYGLQKTQWEKLSSGAYELWINGLVSFPPSHVANIGSNVLTLIASKPEGLLSAGIDSIRSVITKTPRERFAGEISQDIFSSIKGLHDGLRQFFQSWKTGKADITKFEKMPSALPVGIRKFMPTTGLMAEDEFFKGLIKWTELNRISYRQTMKEGLKGEAFKTRLNELINNPTESMLEEVATKAKYLTYQKELGSIGNWVLRGRTIVPGLKYFIPFVRTPANIGKFALERTPLNIPRIIFKAGKGELIGGELSDEIAKTLTGTMLGTGTFVFAMEGFVTGGGPKNKLERDEKMRTGWQPYSFHIGEKYYPYGRYEPIGSIVGMAADFYELMKNMTEDEKYNVAAGIAGAINNNISNKTFMQGFSTLTDFISDPGKYGERTISGLVGSIVPGIVAGTARTIDPYLRDAQGIIDRVKTRIPVVSETVPFKLNVWGDPIERLGIPITRFISPTQVSEEKGTPIDYELEKLKLNLGMPSKKIKIKGLKEIELEPDEYQKMVAEGGQKAKTQLNKFVTKPEFNNLDKEGKIKVIKMIVDKYRENARQLTLRKLRDEGRLVKESDISLEPRATGGPVSPTIIKSSINNTLPFGIISTRGVLSK